MLTHEEYGHFVGLPAAIFLSDGRGVKLEKDFSFIDPNGQRWKAPKNTIVDGASIPKPFWSVIGGPFEGQYRDASIIHDYYCVAGQRLNKDWREVHRTFYFGMRARGVSETLAKIMFAAVYYFGPRWGKAGSTHTFLAGPDETSGVRETVKLPVYDPTRNDIAPNTVDELQKWVSANNPSLERIEEGNAPVSVSRHIERDQINPAPETDIKDIDVSGQ